MSSVPPIMTTFNPFIKSDPSSTYADLAKELNQADPSIAAIQALLTTDVDIHAASPGNVSLFFCAIFKKLTDVIDVFLQHGAQINLANENGTTPLLAAVENNDLATTKLLLENGAAAVVDTPDQDGRTPLIAAAEKGTVDMARLLIQHKANVNQAGSIKIYKNRNGSISEKKPALYTPLHIIANQEHFQSSQLAFIQLLLENSADINAQDLDGDTPLHNAAWHGHAQIVDLLLQKEANPNAANKDGYVPLHKAAVHGHLAAVTLLLNQNNIQLHVTAVHGRTPLHAATIMSYPNESRLAIVQLFIQYFDQDEAALRAFINAKTSDGSTALFWAANSGELPMTSVLVEEGHSDVNTAKEDGTTPLIIAAERGNIDSIQFLIEHGADITTPDQMGRTPLIVAAANGFLMTVKKLAELTTDLIPYLNVTDEEKNTALMAALKNNSPEVAALLINLGADVNIADENGNTALYMVNQHKDEVQYKPVLNLLIQHGASARLPMGSQSISTPALHSKPKLYEE